MRRPNAYLSFTLDETFATPENFSLLKRAYSYVAPCSMKAGKENTLLITIKMGSHEFMDSFDAAQDTSWETEVSEWLRTKIRKVKETMEECDNPKRRGYMGVIPFTWLILNIQGKELRFFLANNEFPPVFEIIGAFRDNLWLSKTPYNDIDYAVFPSMDTIESYRKGIATAPEASETSAASETLDAAPAPDDSSNADQPEGQTTDKDAALPPIDYTYGQVVLSSGEVRTIPTA